MTDGLLLRPIASVKSDFPDKFGIPRQSGLVEQLRAQIIFAPEYRDQNAVRGLEEFSHIWLIWEFSAVRGRGWSATVKPPRLGGNERMGVFATRSPFRPNPLGLSCVRLEKVEFHPVHGPVLHVAGADLMDGTPIYDVKPYIAYADSHPEATAGFTSVNQNYRLHVDFPQELLAEIPAPLRAALIGVLEQDPRPSYQSDPSRVYGLRFSSFDVRFTVTDKRLTVCEILRLGHS